MSKIIIKQVHTLVTMDAEGHEHSNYDILIEENVIRDIGPDLPVASDVRVLDGKHKIALPGFVNTHTHMFQVLTRDLPRIANAQKIDDRLRARYQIYHELDAELVYISALVSLGMLMKTGCTLVSDNYYAFPDSAERELIDAEIKAAQQLGVRFHPTRGAQSLDDTQGGIPPNNLVETDEAILLDFERLVNKYHDPSPFSMLRIALSPVAVFCVTDNLMTESAHFARQHQVHLHTHLAESPYEDIYCQERFGMRPFEHMENLGWVGPDVWYAHAIRVSDEEIKRMGEYRCGVASCPVSNARNNNGIAPILKMREHGVRVGFGVDGGAGYGDMIAEIQSALLLHRYRSEYGKVDRFPEAREMLQIATRGGAEVLGWQETGSLEVGKAADIILIDIHELGYAGTVHDLVSSIVLFGGNHFVDTTIVNGEIVVEAGKLTRIDEDELIEEANRLARRYVKRASDKTGEDYFHVKQA